MSDRSAIEWTDATWNPIRARVMEIQNDGSGKERIGWHCEHVSEGCRECYAERFNLRLGTGRDFKPGELYRPENKGYRNGEVKLFRDEKMLTLPLRWKKPRRIFVCSMTDLFADFVPDEFIDKMFAVMALCPQHTFQVLTKRAQRMRDYVARNVDWSAVLGATWTSINTNGRIDARRATELNHRITASAMAWPLPNVWLGVSAERQQEADERIPLLLQTPAAVRFISAEPLLGRIDLVSPLYSGEAGITMRGYLRDHAEPDDFHHHAAKLDWVIAGGESGPKARLTSAYWLRLLRDQCSAAGAAFHFKQWGEYLPVGQSLPGYDKVHGATAVKPGRMKLHCGGTPKQAPSHAFAESGVDFASTTDGFLTFRVGKKAAGRLLDGVEHNGFPKTTENLHGV